VPWLPNTAFKKVFISITSIYKGILMGELVQADTFDNNRVSAILMSTNKVSSLAGVHTYECATAASVLHENIMDPTSAFSFEPDQSAFRSAVKGEGRGKTFFDWLKAHVRFFLHFFIIKSLNSIF
jgi:hypothetical protein